MLIELSATVRQISGMGAGALRPVALARGFPIRHVQRQSRPDKRRALAPVMKPAAHALVNLHTNMDLIYPNYEKKGWGKRAVFPGLKKERG